MDSIPRTTYEKIIKWAETNDIELHRGDAVTLIDELDVCMKSINNLSSDIKENWIFSNDDGVMRQVFEDLQDLQLTVYLLFALMGNNMDALLHDRIKYKQGMTESVDMKGVLPEMVDKIKDLQVNGEY